MSKLFSPLHTGQLELRHRVVLSCGGPAGASARAAAQYATTGGLIIAPARRPERLGAFAEQVRKKGGLALARIYHSGLARGLDSGAIDTALAAYRACAVAARAGGFGGVELDAGVNSLPWRYMRAANNPRSARDHEHLGEAVGFLADAVQAVIDVWGADYVGVRVSAPGRKWDLDEAALQHMVTVLKTLHDQEVAFVHLAGDMASSVAPPQAALRLRRAFPEALMVDGDGTEARARAAVSSRWADAVVFDTSHLNPKIVATLRRLG